MENAEHWYGIYWQLNITTSNPICTVHTHCQLKPKRLAQTYLPCLSCSKKIVLDDKMTDSLTTSTLCILFIHFQMVTTTHVLLLFPYLIHGLDLSWQILIFE